MDMLFARVVKILLGAGVCLGAFVFVALPHAEAATLRVTSNATTLAPGETATLNVYVDSNGVAINSADATLTFPTNLFSVVSVSKANSVFSLWVEEPSFSNGNGVITFDGGLPTPGYTGSQGNVVSIVVRAKQPGSGTFAFGAGSVRANDGFGTDVLSRTTGKSLVVTAPATTPPPTAPAETPPTHTEPATPGAPGAVAISSPTHPDAGMWYQNKSPQFAWTVPAGVDAVQVGIDTNPDSAPQVTYAPAITGKTVSDLDDGVWYFKLRARKGGVWGPVTTRIARIDSIAPQSRDVSFAYDAAAQSLTVHADIVDADSGMDHYDLSVNGSVAQRIAERDFVNHAYTIPLALRAVTTVTLTAYDVAGNTTQATRVLAPEGLTALRLDPLPVLVPADRALILRGTAPGVGVAVLLQIRQGDTIERFTAVSGADAQFVVLSPQLRSGPYEIWATAGEGGSLSESQHLHTRATSQQLLVIGDHAFRLARVLVIVVLLSVFMLSLAFFTGRRYGLRALLRLGRHAPDIGGGNRRMLFAMKKRLEKHLGFLQKTRRERVLTKDEKEIKQALEADLDAVDKALEK